jgi:hypothetical protein
MDPQHWYIYNLFSPRRRIEERASLKHRNASRFLQEQAKRAKLTKDKDIQVPATYSPVTYIHKQCCGSGSGIRCLFDPWNRDPDWVKIRIRIRDEQPGSYELRDHFLGLKYLNSLVRIRNPGSGMEKIRIRDGKNSDPG